MYFSLCNVPGHRRNGFQIYEVVQSCSIKTFSMLDIRFPSRSCLKLGFFVLLMLLDFEFSFSPRWTTCSFILLVEFASFWAFVGGTKICSRLIVKKYFLKGVYSSEVVVKVGNTYIHCVHLTTLSYRKTKNDKYIILSYICVPFQSA